eukprot:Tamp_11720.p1 GENE.Tamp_11720~~Tamp_11720.p1  ORF type:complete len:625 (+),score=55.28 Tamp_11720:1-1875(+)
MPPPTWLARAAAAAALVASAAGHCAGEGFPGTACASGCVNGVSQAPSVGTMRATDALVFPGGVAVSPDGRYALVSDFSTSQISMIDLAFCRPDGRQCAATLFAGAGAGYQDGEGTVARFASPSGMGFTPDGKTVLVAEFRGHRVRAIDTATRRVTTVAGSGAPGREDGTRASFNFPSDVTVTPDGRAALVTDGRNNLVRRIHLATGAVTTLAGNSSSPPGYEDGTAELARFWSPRSIAITSDGRKAVVADRNNNKIRLLDLASRAVSTLAGNYEGVPGLEDGDATQRARFRHPRHVITIPPQDPRHGDSVLVCDGDNHRLRLFEIGGGRVTTFAGGAESGLRDGPAAEAQFNTPRGLALVPGTGKALVADSLNGVLRLVTSGACTKCLSGGASCSECAAGAVQVLPSHSACTPCPSGATSARGGVSWMACECMAGFAAAASGDNKCEPCGHGTYKNVTGQAACVACPKNSVSQTGSVSEEDCLCLPGYYKRDGHCWGCDVGSYKPTMGSGACTKCGRGAYAAVFAATICSSCPRGKSSPRTGATSPFECTSTVEEEEEDGGDTVTVLPGSYLVTIILLIAACGAAYYFQDEIRSCFALGPRHASEGSEVRGSHSHGHSHGRNGV